VPQSMAGHWQENRSSNQQSIHIHPAFSNVLIRFWCYGTSRSAVKFNFVTNFPYEKKKSLNRSENMLLTQPLLHTLVLNISKISVSFFSSLKQSLLKIFIIHLLDELSKHYFSSTTWVLQSLRVVRTSSLLCGVHTCIYSLQHLSQTTD
jgi:hypothetical protein